MHLRTKAVVAATAAFMIAGAGAALADNAVVDSDLVVTGAQSYLALGAIPCNEPTVSSIAVMASRNGGGNVFANGAGLTVSHVDTTGPVQLGTVSPGIKLPPGWESAANNTLSDSVRLPVTVTPTTSTTGSFDSFSAEVFLTGARAGGGTLTRSVTFPVTWSTDCTPPPPANTAPSAPGVPAASQNPTQGGFSLTWDASTDAEKDAFTYTLQGKRANDATWSTLASGLTSASHDFGPGAPDEGTWTFQVKAVETKQNGLQSTWSGASAGVVVDRTAPNKPTAAPATDPVYTDGFGVSWWKDTATVNFTDNGDPILPDESAGSGVAAVSSPATYTANGAHTAAGRASDRAGNVSDEGTATVHVDSEAPVVTATCPSDPVKAGTSFQVGWTTSDTGGSGVAGNASGTVTLTAPTQIGTTTATLDAGLAADNVGHTSEGTACGYTVVYNFAGFFSPVSMDKVNVVKAGSAIPLKFNLGGDYGLDIIKGTKVSLVAGTKDGTPVDTTVFAIGSGLQYDATTGQYTYVWKTDKTWAGTSGTMTLTLLDGVEHTVQVSFK